jgi:hypothetical protein
MSGFKIGTSIQKNNKATRILEKLDRITKLLPGLLPDANFFLLMHL